MSRWRGLPPTGARSRGRWRVVGGLTWGLVAALTVAFGLGACGTTPVGGGLAPGRYAMEVTLSGGSGRATIQSPTVVTVRADSMTAEIVWSSPSYTWMELAGTRYPPTNSPGENATFSLPVELDVDLPVSAETVAMSRPHVVDYVLRFDSRTARGS